MARILVVARDGGQRELLKAMLKELGHTVKHSHGGPDAYNELGMMEFGLVIGDWRDLLGGDPTLAEQIRDHKSCCDIPIVVTATVAAMTDEDRQEAELVHAEVIGKPFSMGSLRRTVSQALQGPQLKWVPPTSLE